jgi:hypothetical protein
VIRRRAKMVNDPAARISWYRYIARTLLLSITTLCFVFAMLSGAEQYGGGLKGIMQNSPNALPWAALYLINVLTWRFERVGGMALIVATLFMVNFFHVMKGNWVILWFVMVPLFLLGMLFIYCGYKAKTADI